MHKHAGIQTKTDTGIDHVLIGRQMGKGKYAPDKSRDYDRSDKGTKETITEGVKCRALLGRNIMQVRKRGTDTGRAAVSLLYAAAGNESGRFLRYAFRERIPVLCVERDRF